MSNERMDSRQALFLAGPIPRALFTLAVPIIPANLLQTGYQLTDAFWVGRLGASAVTAISVSFPVTFLVIALGFLRVSFVGILFVFAYAMFQALIDVD